MIYGYGGEALNEYGLRRMREISLSAPPDVLRELATFLMEAADEAGCAIGDNWHKHATSSLDKKLGCSVVVIRYGGGEKDKKEDIAGA